MNNPNTHTASGTRRTPWWRSIAMFCALMLLGIAQSFGQTTLISPTGDGGFETGATFATNGWTVVNNNPVTPTNQWYCGSPAILGHSNRLAYVSNDGGTSNTYTNNSDSRVAFYRNVSFPAGETAITLSFTFGCTGEGSYDGVQVALVPTTTTITSSNTTGGGTAASILPYYTGAVILGTSPHYNLTGVPNAVTISITVPASFAGTTQQLVFSWRNDTSVGTNPPGSVDNISLVSALPSPATCPTTFVPADLATLVPTNQVLSWSGATGAPSPTYDVYFSTNSALVAAKDPSVRVLTGTAATTYAPAMAFATQYYWMVVPTNASGGPATCAVNSFTTSPPSLFTTTATGGLWSSPGTWAGGVVPAAGNNVSIPAGAVVTVDQVINYLNYQVDGVMQWNATANAMTCTGNFDVGATGRFYPMTTGLGAVTLNFLGNFTNAGYADLAAASMIFGGSGTQNLNNTGTLVGNGTKAILRVLLMQGSGSLNINTPIIISGNLIPLIGTLNTNGNLELDNTAQVFGQVQNGRIEEAVVTAMGSLLPAAPQVTGTWPAGTTGLWLANTAVLANAKLISGGNVYLVTMAGTTDAVNPPVHTTGIAADGTAQLLWLGPTGVIGTGFQVTGALTAGTQIWYGTNLYTVTVGGIASATAPPTHLAGTAASGAATLAYAGTAAAVSVNYDAANQVVRSLNITNSGSGYFAAPAIGFATASGTNPTATSVVIPIFIGVASNLAQKQATATVSGALPINAPGTQGIGGVGAVGSYGYYTAAPTVGIGGPSLVNFVTVPGAGYTSVPVVTFTGGTIISGTNTFTTTVAAGQVVSCYLTTSALYSVPPTGFTISGGGGAGLVLTIPAGCWAQVTANLNAVGQLNNYTVTTPGFGYAAAPTMALSTVTAPQVAAVTPTCRIGLYNLTMSNFLANAINGVTPVTVNAPHTEANLGPLMPANRRINVLTLGAGNQGFTLSAGNLELYAAAPITLTAGILSTGANTLVFSNPNYAGQAGSTTSSVLGKITLTNIGGPLTRTFPFQAAFAVNTGATNNAVPFAGNTATTFSATQVGAPSGSVGITGTRSYRLQLPGGTTFGNNPTATLNYNVNDLLNSDQQSLFVAQSTALTGPWTVRSLTTGTGGLPATGSRTTAVGAPGPITISGDDYFAWSSSYVPVNLNYTVARTTGNTFNSILTTGSSVGFTGTSTDDQTSPAVSIPASTFQYLGQTVTGFNMCTNGWIKLITATSPSATSTSFSNVINSAIPLIVAPFWDDLTTNPHDFTNATVNARSRYQIIGGTPGSRQIVVEWNNYTVFGAGGPSLTFQVVLDESDNSIKFNYGLFQGFNGTNNHRYTYTTGIGASVINGNPLPGQVFAMQYENSTAFSNQQMVLASQGANALSSMPECNSSIKLTPGTYPGFTPPAETAPANNEAATATVLTPQPSFPSNLCGNFYSSRFATPSAQTVCSGNADDDVWFRFTATQPVYTARVYGSGGYRPRVEVLNAPAATPLSPAVCVVSAGDGGVVDAVLTGLTINNDYYIRVYHEGGGVQALATANLNASGNVIGFNLINGGSGYSSTTSGGITTNRVRITGGGGTDAAATINQTGGVVTNLTLQTGGYGYTSAPTVTIEKPNWAHIGEFALVLFAPLPNDDCAGAFTITPQLGCSPTNGNSNGGTPSATIPACVGNPDDDVWYTFTPTVANPTITVVGDVLYDAVVQVFSGTCGTLTSLYCQNATGNGGTETVATTGLTTGVPHFVRIYHNGAGASTGLFSICVDEGGASCPVQTSPANNASLPDLLGTTLTWNASAPNAATGYDVYFDTNPVPTTVVSTNQAGTSYVTGALLCNTSYYWMVRPRNALGLNSTCSTVLTFTTPTSVTCPTVYAPLTGATNVSTAAQTLSWNSIGAGSSYTVYFDTNPVPTTVLTTTTGLTATTPVLACNTQYYWRVEPTNCVGTNTSCVVNTFSTTSAPPPCVSINSPANLASNLPLVATTLSWLSAGAGTTGYDVYFGTNQTDVQNGTGGTFLATVTGTSTTTPVLVCNTQYFWRVAPINCFGTNTTCATSTFTSLNQTPNCATAFTPANNATGVLYSPTLSWSGATGVIASYNVYLGTNLTDVTNGTGGTLLGNTTTANIPATGLLCNTVYYWRVEPTNCVGANVNCAVNSFTTYALSPTCPTAFTPANNAINVAFSPTLTFTGAVGATSYNIYLDNSVTPTTLVGTSTTTSFVAGPLAPGQYYWRVEPTNCVPPAPTCTINTFNVPSCPPVSGLSVASTSVTAASVSFTCAGCVGTYIVEYGLSGFTPGTADLPGTGGTIVTSNSSPVAIIGLLASSTYSFYVRQECTPFVDYSTNVGPVNLTTPEVLCGGNFYDNGGAAGNYSDNANVLRTFCGANPGEVVIASFNSFDTESGWDPLYIYDGPSIASPQFASTNGVPTGNNVYGTGGWWGTQIAPGTAFVSTHPTGCLTFAFTSDPSVNRPGWNASIACAPPTACTVPAGVTASSITASSAQIAWTCSGCVGPYIVEWGLAGFTPGTGATAGFGGTAIAAAASPVTLTGLPAGQNIIAYVRQDCDGGNTTFSNNSYGPANFTTLPGCGGNYYDLGGPAGLYPNGINGTAGLTSICPNNAGDRVIVSFTSFQVESGWDPLYVYNGPTQASPQIASTNGTPTTTPNFGAGGWWGTVAPNNTGIPGTVISTDPSGCLTFVHISDGSVNQAGWTATVACVTPQFTCSTAGTIACSETKTGFTLGGTNTLPPLAQCDYNGGPSTSGVSWWVYNAVADQDVTMSTCGGGMNTRISVFSGICTNLTCVGGVDDGPGCPNGSTEVTFRALMGETYYIAVHGNAANDGVFQLSAFCSPVCTADPNDNDACGTAMAITSQLADGSQVIMTDANTCSLVDGPPTCSGTTPAIGNWYSFNAGANAVHSLYLWNNSLDPQFSATTVSYALFSGTCTNLLAADQVNCTTPGNGANALPALTPGNDYKLFVYNDGSTSQRGSYGLVLDHPGVNDASISAVNYPVGVLCNLVLLPQVVLTNEGEATLTQVDITVSIAGGNSYVYPWTGSLASGASVTLTLDPITTTSGPHSMTVSTSSPNGATDEIPANDATTVSYDATGQTVVVSITTDNIGSQTSWGLFDAFFFPVGSGGPYTGQNNQTINTSVCLPTTFGNCFYFFVQDGGGDGMCCLNGTGSWELRDETGRIVLHDDGVFTQQSPSLSPVNPSYFAHEFCLPLGPSPILASECNIFTNTMQSKVYTAAVPGATTYQFEFSDPNAGFRRRIALPRPWVQFAEMVTNPLTPGTVYFARARVDQNAAGFSDDNFGAGCDMSIDPASIGCPALINNTALPTHSCGVTKAFGGSDKIWAQPLFGATQYRFRFVNTGEGYVREILRPTYVCLLSWVTNPLVNGSTYTVTVNALVGTTWTGYCGAACSVTILNPAVNGDNTGRTPELVLESGVQMWPNPVRDGRVNLRIDELVDATQRITVDMYDVYGKRVMTNEYENGGAVFSTMLDLDANIAAGVYNVNITVNDKQYTQRLTVVR